MKKTTSKERPDDNRKEQADQQLMALQYLTASLHYVLTPDEDHDLRLNHTLLEDYATCKSQDYSFYCGEKAQGMKVKRREEAWAQDYQAYGEFINWKADTRRLNQIKQIEQEFQNERLEGIHQKRKLWRPLASQEIEGVLGFTEVIPDPEEKLEESFLYRQLMQIEHPVIPVVEQTPPEIMEPEPQQSQQEKPMLAIPCQDQATNPQKINDKIEIPKAKPIRKRCRVKKPEQDDYVPKKDEQASKKSRNRQKQSRVNKGQQSAVKNDQMTKWNINIAGHPNSLQYHQQSTWQAWNAGSMIPTILPELVQIIREGQERSSDPTAEDTLIKNASDTSAKTQQSGKPKKIVKKKGKTDPHLQILLSKIRFTPEETHKVTSEGSKFFCPIPVKNGPIPIVEGSHVFEAANGTDPNCALPLQVLRTSQFRIICEEVREQSQKQQLPSKAEPVQEGSPDSQTQL